MKFYLSMDMEGVTALPDYTYVDSKEANYERGRRLMTGDANAIISGAFDRGAKGFLVNDSHSKMNNLIAEDLHEDALLITGGVKNYSMVEGLDQSYDGAFFGGYHARAGQKGVMAHSMIFAVRTMWINDVEVGELGFNAYVAGFHGVPVLLVAGDDAACKEAEALIPNIVTAAVKESLTRSAVKTLHPKKAQAFLLEKTHQAIDNREHVKPLVPPDEPLLRIEFTNYGEAELAAMMPGCEIEKGTTVVRFQAKDILEAYRAMLVMTELAMQAKFC
ncbi:M55 family metallopeptidase [Planomicrobium sp. CPCC 101079]|uniref:M55 family metallopeptidase n=1 Tax=Planomicrobium sp. CPCC 101079 TaxID=2599618 RepID=UPI0011B752E4|nr:M55 family metallopeptidase [Planomicrobium sp. CPCC 101079]TWT03548.1 M55 family metallopeptidase [Planomicrobium sp. CPCC 101079]